MREIQGKDVTDKKQPDTFHVSFDTKANPGFVRSVKITITEDLIMDDEVVRIDLADHPLYLKLEEYVRSNPRGKRK